MNRLDLEAVNSRSPYDVHSVGNQYVFVTDTGTAPPVRHQKLIKR